MMCKPAKRVSRAGGLAGAVAVAAVVAACGSSSGSGSHANSSAAAAPASSSKSAAPSASAKGADIGTASGAKGTYLTGASGRAIYLWVADTHGKSVCSGACAQAWPPVTTHGAPVASHGVKPGDLGTTTRSDGARQVTYDGHPLYYFVGDTSAGETTGEGNNGFGAKWWLVSPGGAAITSGGSSGGAAAGSSSTSSGLGY